jgi:hypothetical protein
MEDTIVVLRFNDLGQARHALDELKRLDRDRRLQVSAAALVGRSNDGRIEASGGSEDAEGYYLPKDGIVGIMVDALSGPTGAVFGRPTESFRGQGAPPTHEAEREPRRGARGARRKRHPTSRARRLRRAPGAMSGATAGRR